MLKDRHNRHAVRQMAAAERGSEMMLEGEEGEAGWAPEVTVSRGDDGIEGREGNAAAGVPGGLAGLVGQLLAVGEEGCFRLVVGFL